MYILLGCRATPTYQILIIALMTSGFLRLYVLSNYAFDFLYMKFLFCVLHANHRCVYENVEHWPGCFTIFRDLSTRAWTIPQTLVRTRYHNWSRCVRRYPIHNSFRRAHGSFLTYLSFHTTRRRNTYMSTNRSRKWITRMTGTARRWCSRSIPKMGLSGTK